MYQEARDSLRRDLADLVRYFAPYGVEADADVLANDLGVDSSGRNCEKTQYEKKTNARRINL